MNLLVLSFFNLLLVAAKTLAVASEPIDWQAYEQGSLGLYPQVKFESVNFKAPLVHVNQWGHRCDNDSFTFLSPNGPGVPTNKALILDYEGNLVWAKDEQGAVSNLRVQTYKGAKYITYWVGDDNDDSHGLGYYKMLDPSYTLQYTVTALGGLDGDWHEFTITPHDTAILTSFHKTPWNLSEAGGRSDGYIWDCVFQEVDIEKEEILFEWRASNHYSPKDSGTPYEHEGFEQHPWDWFHLNSVQKDFRSNYIITSRYRNTVVYIDGQSGEALWHFGDFNNTFRHKSLGTADKLRNPRMAGWIGSDSTLLFLTNVNTSATAETHELHGFKVKLDLERSSTKVMTQFQHPGRFSSETQGSIQSLQNGNLLIGYGSVSAYSEYSWDGKLVCDTHFAPVNTTVSASSSSGVVGTYRVYKEKWVGLPQQRPDVKLDSTSISVSWNGATEVRAWRIAGRDSSFKTSTTAWTEIGTFPKTGFETKIILAEDVYTSYKVMAIDARGNLLQSLQINSEGNILDFLHVGHHVLVELGSGVAHLAVMIACFALLLFVNRRYLPDISHPSKLLPRFFSAKKTGPTPMAGTRHQLSPLPKRRNPFETHVTS